MDPRYPPPPHTKPPRRDLPLQGPRPTPLRINKDSRKIRKPPAQAPPPDPVIIYTISPKVIHVDLADFMGLVQRLTGPGNADRAFSPARPAEADLDRPETNHRPGILSPVPASLPPVSPCFFSPSYLEPGFLSFLHDLSPVGLPGRPSPGRGLIFSPGRLLSTPVIPSPGAAVWDLFKRDF